MSLKSFIQDLRERKEKVQSGGGEKAQQKQIAMGKLLNAGQACIAPDYVFAPADTMNEFVDAGLLRKFELDGRSVFEIVIDVNHQRVHHAVDRGPHECRFLAAQCPIASAGMPHGNELPDCCARTR